MITTPDSAPGDPYAALERAFIDEFLRSRGYTDRILQGLPSAEAESLRREATAHATLKLAEIEARARLVDELD